MKDALGSPAEGTEEAETCTLRMLETSVAMLSCAPKRDWHAWLKRSNGPSRGSRQPGRSARWAGYRARKRRHGPCAGDEGGLARHAGGSSAWNALTALAGAGGHASNRGVGPLNARKIGKRTRRADFVFVNLIEIKKRPHVVEFLISAPRRKRRPGTLIPSASEGI